MNARARRSLRDFDQEAITQADDLSHAESTPELAQQAAGTWTATTPPEPAQPSVGPSTAAETKATKQTTKPAAEPATRAASATTRTGLYFHPATFEAAKSAYLVDFDALPDSADSFARWISATLAAHAALTAAQRAAAVDHLPDEPRTGSGFTRSFELDDTTVKAMETAITDDRRAHRYVTRSQFSNEAVRLATEAAKNRAGGVLPPAPARLPNRPVR